MTEIVLSETEQVAWAVKSFRRKDPPAGILTDLRAKRFYVKPSAARRKKAQWASRRLARKRRRGQ